MRMCALRNAQRLNLKAWFMSCRCAARPDAIPRPTVCLHQSRPVAGHLCSRGPSLPTTCSGTASLWPSSLHGCRLCCACSRRAPLDSSDDALDNEFNSRCRAAYVVIRDFCHMHALLPSSADWQQV
jgi:hypothetical protein